MPKKTTISIFLHTRESLKNHKIYPHESYDEIINRLLKQNGTAKK